MTVTRTVVVFAQEADAPVDAVVRQLARRDVAVFRADTGWFPGQLVLDARLDGAGHWIGRLSTQHRSGVEQLWAVWLAGSPNRGADHRGAGRPAH